MNVVYKDIEDLILYVNNPRKNDHSIDKVASSIKNFGFKVPIVIDSKNEIISGHTRVKACKKLNINKIPCIIADDLTEAQIKAFRIADNRVAQESEWDMELLNIEIETLKELDFDIDNLGFDDNEIDSILIHENEVDVIEDEFDEEPPDNPISQIGDIWLLGNHILMCGNSTTNDVNILMNEKKADMVFTDPPYNINFGNNEHPKFKNRNIKNDNMNTEEYKNFCTKFIEIIKKNVVGCVYIFSAPAKDGRILFTLADNLLHCSTTIIWYKDTFVLGRGKYQNIYEPIWFGWVESGCKFKDDRTLSNVWEIPRPKKSELHPTMKPLEVIAKAINDASVKNDIVLDLFGGSGSTLIACEQTNRICYMMELDESYVDVIVKRYINFKESDSDVYLIRDNKKFEYKDL